VVAAHGRNLALLGAVAIDGHDAVQGAARGTLWVRAAVWHHLRWEERNEIVLDCQARAGWHDSAAWLLGGAACCCCRRRG
jgi:hypothetical protein